MKKYLPVTYFGMFGFGDGTDSMSIIKNFRRIFVECVEGNYSEDDLNEANGDTVLVLNESAHGGYRSFTPRHANGRWMMKGYGFICSSDSRYARQYGSAAIPLHDRCESN
ncbi:hypothetical protein [Alishewanella phage vB_AspM_Slickus01]|nr:hypothetical protein [Alishewanella phage vB_AspM_Slickus01]